MDIYFDTRNRLEAVEQAPMSPNVAIHGQVPRFKVYSVRRFGRHGFDWKASLLSVVHSISPIERQNLDRWTHDCYRKAAKIAWIQLYEHNNGSRVPLADHSIFTFVNSGMYPEEVARQIWLHKYPTGERVSVYGFCIGSDSYVVEKLP